MDSLLEITLKILETLDLHFGVIESEWKSMYGLWNVAFTAYPTRVLILAPPLQVDYDWLNTLIR